MVDISGQKVQLLRASPKDRERVYDWFTHSDLTPRMMGQPLFADYSPPTYEAFCQAWAPYFFDGTQPFDGRGFLIRAEDQDIGFLSHGPIDLFRDVVELKFWLASSQFTGKGYGSDALRAACRGLQALKGVNRFLARPSRRNVHALRALRRAGFRETDLEPESIKERFDLGPSVYSDETLLFQVLNMPPAKLKVKPEHIYVFIDSEFTSLTAPQLMSVGAVATDATAFYCELSDFPKEACSEFVQKVVLPLLDGDAVPHAMARQSFAHWLAARASQGPVVLVSDSGFDRWAIADLLGDEGLPPGVQWQRVPVAYELLDETALSAGLRRHHALDDARALRQAIMSTKPKGAAPA
ncbi:MAG TPA: GNAT family N-acetyltransferase [Burkholderiaceae bacterium]|nr:GNAT family N-acetyltransferase [Burkholderiaceae bacterium]